MASGHGLPSSNYGSPRLPEPGFCPAGRMEGGASSPLLMIIDLSQRVPRRHKPVPSGILNLARTAALLLAWSGAAQAAPNPIIDARFDEQSGLVAANSGTLAGQGEFFQESEFPVFTSQVPTGSMTPKNNVSAVDFGGIAAGQGGRAIDFITGADGTLGPLSAFTLTGWINPRDLTIGWGGNRILFALSEPNGPGFDLVHLSNGALRIGINQWPDGANGGGPSSSPGILKASAETAAGNWVFFAVTYDPALETGQLKYYFGRPDQLAQLDSAHSYRGGTPENGGLVDLSGSLTVGNFGIVAGARNETGPSGGSRVFRGLIDEIKVYDQALALADIQRAQLNGELPPVPVSITGQPASQTAFAGQPVTFQVQASGAAPISYQWEKNGTALPGATGPSYTAPAVAVTDSGAEFRVTVTNPSGRVTSDAATLTVMEENGHKVFLSFSEGGTTTTNRGNLSGSGSFVQRDGFPITSASTPSGPYAPPQNLASVDFGAMLDNQGGRAIDFTNPYGNTLGSMTGFTVCAWVNAIDLRAGWGGNRIVFALASPGGAGLDLVQLDDGSLQLGVNQWPDGTPARSSPGFITESATAAADNWVFLAVTYDSALPSGNVSFYFGKPDQAAQLDVTTDYTQGALAQTGALTVGNFSVVDSGARNGTGPTSGSRCFRGLIDEINVFNKVLTVEEIQAVQKAPAYQSIAVEPVAITSQPLNKLAFAGQSVAFNVVFAGSPPVSVQWQRDGQDIPGATQSTLTLQSVSASDNGARFQVRITNPAGTVTSQPATLTIAAQTGLRAALSFSEGAGTSTSNQGDLEGTGTFERRDGFPAFSSQVPSGPFAPANNSSSVDFGTIAEGQGGRAIDFANPFDSTLGSMTAFTVCGWLNSRDLRAGWGGNRIAFALAAPAGPGFDLVQLNDGSLRLGVNQWPDSAEGGGGPSSNPGMIPEDLEAGAGNWVFFAVTYDSSLPFSQVAYYFGRPEQAAQLDVLTDYYDRGPIERSGALTVGNFSSVVAARNETGPAGGSRVFRGLIDELKVFNKALTLAEIQAAQKAPAATVAVAPGLSAQLQPAGLVVQWESASTFQLQSTDDLSTGTWTNVATVPEVAGNRHSVTVPISGSRRFFRLRTP